MSDLNSKPRALSFLTSHIEGNGDSKGVTTALVSDDRVPFFLANDSVNKAAVSLEQIFIPFASSSGTAAELGKLPFYKGTGKESNLTVWGAGSRVYAYDTSVVNVTKDAGGFALGISPSIGRGQSLSTEEINDMTQYSGDVRRVIGMRLPMFAVGTGLSVSGTITHEVFGDTSRPDSPGAGSLEDFQAMKVGPVDFRWDERKQSWVGSDFFSSDIAYGFLSSSITAPSGRYQSTQFTVTRQHYSSSGTWDNDGTIICLNKDPNFSLTYTEDMDIFVKAIRLQSPTVSQATVYMPFYIGCA